LFRIIIDQNLTEYLRELLPNHDVRHAHEMGWDRLNNGELLTAAEQAGFEVMLTADQSIPRQNRMKGRQIALVILSTNRWPTIQQASDRILRALDGPQTSILQVATTVGSLGGNRVTASIEISRVVVASLTRKRVASITLAG
jgi:hypothetical protein